MADIDGADAFSDDELDTLRLDVFDRLQRSAIESTLHQHNAVPIQHLPGNYIMVYPLDVDAVWTYLAKLAVMQKPPLLTTATLMKRFWTRGS